MSKEKRQHIRVRVDTQAMEIAVLVVRVLALLKQHSSYVEDKALRIIREELRG